MLETNCCSWPGCSHPLGPKCLSLPNLVEYPCLASGGGGARLCPRVASPLSCNSCGPTGALAGCASCSRLPSPCECLPQASHRLVRGRPQSLALAGKGQSSFPEWRQAVQFWTNCEEPSPSQPAKWGLCVSWTLPSLPGLLWWPSCVLVGVQLANRNRPPALSLWPGSFMGGARGQHNGMG